MSVGIGSGVDDDRCAVGSRIVTDLELSAAILRQSEKHLVPALIFDVAGECAEIPISM